MAAEDCPVDETRDWTWPYPPPSPAKERGHLSMNISKTLLTLGTLFRMVDERVPSGSVVEPEPEMQLFCLKGTGFGTGSNIKCNTKVKKSKIRGQLSGKQCCF
jgi:hypothetical protein